MFRKVLVANRGEIAVRVIRALRELGIASVAVYSDVDRGGLPVRMADEAVAIGSAPSHDSYLRGDRIIEAARATGAEAIHPGYGFLSENADFADACQSAGLVFVGPSAASIRALGSKTEARKLALSAGAPVVPGTEEPVSDPSEARRIARQVGYPVILKAAAGGGGKGMRRVDSEADLESALRDASSEAERAFSNGAVYIEKYLQNPRHIEIQLLGDHHGNMIHLGERECSIQRRHQKVIEECPSPLVAGHLEMRAAMGQAAIAVARAAGYYNAGTAEFLVDRQRNFYFLEMNTRLQVEHPVTELVTGLDLVHLQLEIAAGCPLRLRQQDVSWRGAAIECRIYAEDPDNHFFPSPGLISQLERPAGPGIRLDSGVYQGWTIPLEYDPLLAKLAVWGETRAAATQRMLRALEEYHVAGVKTNLSFFRNLLLDPQFAEARLHTGFIDEFFLRHPPHPAEAPRDSELVAVAALVAALESGAQTTAAVNDGSGAPGAGAASPWRDAGRREALR
jgi:acetyl-CoA carboxylase, biotin carboxylase subunit